MDIKKILIFIDYIRRLSEVYSFILAEKILKSCIYVKDLVSISYNLINQEKLQIFNMCYNKSFSIEKIVYTISSTCNFKIPKYNSI